MNTVKDLIENEELNQFVTEDLEDFAEDTAVTYEVWAIGYDKDDSVTDADMFIEEFTDPDEAVAKAKELTLADIVHQASEESDTEVVADVAYISVEVETVVADDEEGTMNVGTIFKKEIWIDEQAEDESVRVEYSEVVPIAPNEYTLLEDGSLEISCDILKDYNKNDIVQIWFTDENDKTILTYKIISKTTSNNFICEFVY